MCIASYIFNSFSFDLLSDTFVFTVINTLFVFYFAGFSLMKCFILICRHFKKIKYFFISNGTLTTLIFLTVIGQNFLTISYWPTVYKRILRTYNIWDVRRETILSLHLHNVFSIFVISWANTGTVAFKVVFRME